MNDDHLLQRLKSLVCETMQLDRPAEDLDPHVSLFEDGLGLDSMTIVELVLLIESRFGIVFTDAELTPETFSSLDHLCSELSAKLQEVSP